MAQCLSILCPEENSGTGDGIFEDLTAPSGTNGKVVD